MRVCGSRGVLLDERPDRGKFQTRGLEQGFLDYDQMSKAYICFETNNRKITTFKNWQEHMKAICWWCETNANCLSVKEEAFCREDWNKWKAAEQKSYQNQNPFAILSSLDSYPSTGFTILHLIVIPEFESRSEQHRFFLVRVYSSKLKFQLSRQVSCFWWDYPLPWSNWCYILSQFWSTTVSFSNFLITFRES